MIESPLLALLFLLAASLITVAISASQQIGKTQAEAIANRQGGIGKLLFRPKKREAFTYASVMAKNGLLICYAVAAFEFASSITPFDKHHIALSALLVLALFLVTDALIRLLALVTPIPLLTICCQPAALIILPFWPISLLYTYLNSQILQSRKEKHTPQIKDRILEILHDSQFTPYLDLNDQKLLLSVFSFKERIAREVMVPRIDVITLSADTSVRDAAKGFLEEGYSRIPIWKESVDNIIGALYYKDLLAIYFSEPSTENALDSPIEHVLKPVVYTPETKKISHLLQEFRSKQIHLAIVVDEYGGTEGIVTIEDILEELVGEIADEYDREEEALFTILPGGGWIVDAKMSILDVQDELGLHIPQSPEYDTLGGYIFHKAGSIPSKGWRLHQDAFDLEVLSSSEKVVEKVKIIPSPL